MGDKDGLVGQPYVQCGHVSFEDGSHWLGAPWEYFLRQNEIGKSFTSTYSQWLDEIRCRYCLRWLPQWSKFHHYPRQIPLPRAVPLDPRLEKDECQGTTRLPPHAGWSDVRMDHRRLHPCRFPRGRLHRGYQESERSKHLNNIGARHPKEYLAYFVNSIQSFETWRRYLTSTWASSSLWRWDG